MSHCRSPTPFVSCRLVSSLIHIVNSGWLLISVLCPPTYEVYVHPSQSVKSVSNQTHPIPCQHPIWSRLLLRDMHPKKKKRSKKIKENRRNSESTFKVKLSVAKPELLHSVHAEGPTFTCRLSRHPMEGMYGDGLNPSAIWKSEG